jgi:hypothetical protein
VGLVGQEGRGELEMINAYRFMFLTAFGKRLHTEKENNIVTDLKAVGCEDKK